MSSDKNCDLGKWIFGEGASFASSAEFQKLQAEHAQFHKYAGQIIRRADRGEKVSEEIALGARSTYAAASANVVSQIVMMKKKAA